jgi:hypothetical protein
MVECFWVDWVPNEVGVWLRRWTDGTYVEGEPLDCAHGHHHSNMSPRFFVGRRRVRDVSKGVSQRAFKADDPRWPKRCADCSYRFKRGDHRQVFTQRILEDKLTHRTWFERMLPPGAMYDAYWHRDDDGEPTSWYSAPDGITLAVVLPWSRSDRNEAPHGIIDAWTVDGPATPDGQPVKPRAWTRTGDPRANPPTVSATPSIAAGRSGEPGFYHGYLSVQGGRTVLTDHMP